MEQNKPSFFESVMAGASGMAKGMLMVGAIGAVTGGLIGAVLGATVISGGALATGLIGGFTMGQMGAMIGAITGAVTGVVKNREAGSVDPQDIVNMNNINFAQGVQVGRNKNVSKEACDELHAASTHHRDKLHTESPEQTGAITRH